MKILFVLESYYPNIGGVETLFKALGEELADQGHDITILTNHPGGDILTRQIINGVRIRRYKFFSRYLFTVLAFFPALFHAFRHDIIHTTSYNAALPAFFAGLVSGRKVMVTFHEYWGPLWFTMPFFSKLSLRLHYLFEAMLVRLPFHRFIAVSEYTGSSLEKAGVSTSKIVLIYNGIDYKNWKVVKDPTKKDSTDYFAFIYFGRLGISKGLDILIDAIDHLRKETTNFKLHLITSIKPESIFHELKRRIIYLKIEHFIQLHHHMDEEELKMKIISADAVVIPSRTEGFCYSAVESTALGMPIISSGMGALQEVIGGKYLELDELSPKNLSQKMLEAIQGKWQEKPGKFFHLKDTVDRYVQLYNNAI